MIKKLQLYLLLFTPLTLVVFQGSSQKVVELIKKEVLCY